MYEASALSVRAMHSQSLEEWSAEGKTNTETAEASNNQNKLFPHEKKRKERDAGMDEGLKDEEDRVVIRDVVGVKGAGGEGEMPMEVETSKESLTDKKGEGDERIKGGEKDVPEVGGAIAEVVSKISAPMQLEGNTKGPLGSEAVAAAAARPLPVPKPAARMVMVRSTAPAVPFSYPTLTLVGAEPRPPPPPAPVVAVKTEVPYQTSLSNLDSTIDAVITACNNEKENTEDADVLLLPPPKKPKKKKKNIDKENPQEAGTHKSKKKDKSKAKASEGEKKQGSGRKSKEWYLENGLEPGYSKKNKKNALVSQMLERQALEGSGITGNYVTTKDILDAIFLDHNYCQVLYSTSRSRIQSFRHLFGPKDEYKAQFFPETLISPNKFLPPVPSPPPSPPIRSKLEYLLKGGPAALGPKRSTTPSRKYWEAHDETEDEVDVVEIENVEPIPYDAAKAKNIMQQCEKHAKIIRASEAEDNWEDQIVKTGWTTVQRRLFESVVKALHAERLARLAYDKNPNEPVLRRTSLDKTANRIRFALTHVQWNTKTTQWLHGVLVEHLNQSYLAIYLDVLQTLRSFSASLVDKMIVMSTTVPRKHAETNIGQLPDLSVILSELESNPEGAIRTLTSYAERCGVHIPYSLIPEKESISTFYQTLQKDTLGKERDAVNADALSLLLKKPWDPFSPVVNNTKLRKLACNPVFMFIPCVTPTVSPTSVRRIKGFLNLLGALGKVITLPVNAHQHGGSVSRFAKRLLNQTKSKIMETRKIHPDRPLYLIGWGTGSILAATASVSHSVEGVIALAFPLFSLAGPRGTLEDQMLDMKKPILFIIGGRSPDVSVTDMELLRKQLICESSMVVIGCGDKNLRICRYHRERLLVTQSFVDKSIVDEISYFINLHSKHQQVSAAASLERSLLSSKQRKSWYETDRDRKRMASGASCASSIDIRSLDSQGLLDLMDDSSDSRSVSTPASEFGKKRKRSDSAMKEPMPKKVKAEKQKKISGSGSGMITPVPHSAMDDGTGRKSESEYVSPVLSYLGATPGQGGLLHNLLSPPGEKDKTKKPEAMQAKPISSHFAVLTSPSSMTPQSAPIAVLAGGATATPVSGPVIPGFHSLDSMRQYILQHQHVMQKHLQQFQPSSQSSVTSQLMRLLAPPTPLQQSATNPTNVLSSSSFVKVPQLSMATMPSSPAVQVGLPVEGRKIDAGNVGLPADLNVTLLGEPPKTATVTHQQLATSVTQQVAQQKPVVEWRQPQQVLTPGQCQPPNITNTSAPSMIPCQSLPSTSSAVFTMPKSLAHEEFANVVFQLGGKKVTTRLAKAEVESLLKGAVLRCNFQGEDPINIVLKQQISTATVPLTPAPTLALATPSQTMPEIVVGKSETEVTVPVVPVSTSPTPQFPIITGVKSLAPGYENDKGETETSPPALKDSAEKLETPKKKKKPVGKSKGGDGEKEKSPGESPVSKTPTGKNKKKKNPSGGNKGKSPPRDPPLLKAPAGKSKKKHPSGGSKGSDSEKLNLPVLKTPAGKNTKKKTPKKANPESKGSDSEKQPSPPSESPVVKAPAGKKKKKKNPIDESKGRDEKQPSPPSDPPAPKDPVVKSKKKKNPSGGSKGSDSEKQQSPPRDLRATLRRRKTLE